MMKQTLAMLATALALGTSADAAEFQAVSRSFAPGVLANAQFANAMGCTGDNISPDISWSNAPEGTKSFVVTLYDKDAPTGSGWWHWVVVDIPADATSLASGAGADVAKLPAGARMITTDAGQAAFGGTCPPPGAAHTYTLTVKALKVDKLPLPPNASPALVGFLSNANMLASATVSATGKR
jgi:Raf kinase inhibitor-like YbhB/YbcL family protein